MQVQIQGLLAHIPQRLLIEAVVAAALIFGAAIFFRRALKIIVRTVLLVCLLAVIVGGIAILMNNVSLAGPPGPLARLSRFLTVDWAATSPKGDGAATCADLKTLTAAAPARQPRRRHSEATSGTQAADVPVAPEAQDDYPELVRRSYPGIPPQRLFQLAASTLSGGPGWTVLSADPKTLVIQAIYRTRLLGFIDDVRIVVTPDSEIDVCSRSRVGEPDDHSSLGFFHGDFGANIGHIKEFYAALEPAVNVAYRREEIDRTAAEHGVGHRH